ncbi:hypothetical protein DMENIID0001_039640 [Sergentomyia squamirostris]
MRSDGRMLSEWEDNVLFDADDPDFVNLTANGNSIRNSNPPLVATERLQMLNSFMLKDHLLYLRVEIESISERIPRQLRRHTATGLSENS